MSLFDLNLEGEVLKVNFGDEQSSNDKIIVEAKQKAEAIKQEIIDNVTVLRINGVCSLPISMMLCHQFAHLVKAVACFDPKLGKYVVAVSHGADCQIGDLID